MKNKLKILFLQTGGTIDKDYLKPVKSYAFEIGDPAVKRILAKVYPNFDYKIISLLKKDSLDFTDADRKKIFQACKKADATKIIITHGTDTMVETARVLSPIKNKAIILTGSRSPEKFIDSDAMFNIGVAVGLLNVINDGVYIAMNGRIYSWDNCKKDQKTGQFVEKR